MESAPVAKPQLHFTPPSGWMNDPNGLVFFENEWHLFYQYLPVGGSGGKHWGHAVSCDLVNWEHLPVALFPDSLGEIFSGSCVVDAQDTSGFFAGKPGLVAIFTHHAESASGPVESQGVAYSHDRGRTWTKYAGNPVLRESLPDFRDPKVFWHSPSNSWVMILAAGDRAKIYRSDDLKTWTFASAFGKGHTPLCWECPDLFSLPDENGDEVWILSISLLDRDNFKGMVAACIMEYFAGTFDGFTFTADKPGALPLSHGPDDYAAVTFSGAPEGRRILLGWLNHWGYASHTGQMTLPRELRWQDGALVQIPSPIVEENHPWRCVKIESREGAIPLTTIAASPWELILPPTMRAWCIEVRKGSTLVFTVSRNSERNVWSLTRAVASFPAAWKDQKKDLKSVFMAPHEAPASPEAGQPTRIIVDSASVEVFCDGGRAYFSAQIFPPDGEWQVAVILPQRGNLTPAQGNARGLGLPTAQP